jgi:hypothetical protein
MAHVNPARLRTRGPIDPVYGTVNIFYGISFREIIQIILKIHQHLVILQKHPRPFQNFVLVPVILHLGPV